MPLRVKSSLCGKAGVQGGATTRVAVCRLWCGNAPPFFVFLYKKKANTKPLGSPALQGGLVDYQGRDKYIVAMFNYKPSGTCSTGINFDLRDGKVYDISFEDGCEGNLKAISLLLEGMEAGEVVHKLKGLCCGRRKTSCADQLARAIEQRR